MTFRIAVAGTILTGCIVIFAVVWGLLCRDLRREWASISQHRRTMRALDTARMRSHPSTRNRGR